MFCDHRLWVGDGAAVVTKILPENPEEQSEERKAAAFAVRQQLEVK